MSQLRATSPADRLVSNGPTADEHWEPRRVYFVGDTVVDDHVPHATDEADPPTPPGRFRALVDHYSGLLGPRFLELDQPGVWERIETL
jgi:hypothetical protein